MANLTGPVNGNGYFKCGKLQPVIDSVVGVDGIASRCVCAYFQILDYLLSVFWTILSPDGSAIWGDCFCGAATRPFSFAGPEIAVTGNATYDALQVAIAQQVAAQNSAAVIPAISYLAKVLIDTVVTLIRRLPDPSYWSQGNHVAGSSLGSIQSTWIYRFLAPIANASCVAVGNLICFLNSFFFLDPKCTPVGRRFLGGTIAWPLQAVQVIVSLIEGFFQTVIPPICTGGDCGENKPGYQGLKANTLGAAITAFLSFPVDLLIADGLVSCTGVCDPVTLRQFPNNPCMCYNLSPKTRANKDYIEAIFGYGFTATNLEIYQNWWNVSYNATTGAAYCGMYQGIPPSARFNCSNNPTERLCELTQNTLQLPTCVLSNCTSIRLCRYAELPTCGASVGTPASAAGGTERFRPLDGVLLAFIRYLSCIGLAVVLYPLDALLSIIWQISLPFLRLIANLIIFFFSIFTLISTPTNCECVEPMVLNNTAFYPGQVVTLYHAKYASACYACAPNVTKDQCVEGNPNLESLLESSRFFVKPICTGIASFFAALGDIFEAFGELFTTPLELPPSPYRRFKREDTFRQTMTKVRRDGPPAFHEIGDYVYGYNVMDCMWNDLVGCLDRNFEIPYSVSRDETSMLSYLSDNVFVSSADGVSPICDAVLLRWSDKGALSWTDQDVSDAEKKQLTDCLEKRIQGERISALMRDLPSNYFYSSTGNLDLIQTAFAR